MLSAEQMLDAVSPATGVPETFKGYPLGTRAIELAEGGVNHPFLQAFAKPVRDVSCECAREEDPSLPQMLHLLNNAGVLAKVKSPEGRIAGWLDERRDVGASIENVYLATLSRRPLPGELDTAVCRCCCRQGRPGSGDEGLASCAVKRTSSSSVIDRRTTSSCPESYRYRLPVRCARRCCSTEDSS